MIDVCLVSVLRREGFRLRGKPPVLTEAVLVVVSIFSVLVLPKSLSFFK